MAFDRFRPASHFIAPHSWANDPCGAIWVPETKEYIFTYQWNPGTWEGGNSAWGMAKSKDMVTWQDCSPALRNGTSYDSLGVFSGSIVSRLVEGKRVLFLFYTSVSAVPIHWSKPYIEGCESQSVAFSADFGSSWHRYECNPLLRIPPKREATTGWRDPFVTESPFLSALMGVDAATNFMMIASGERGHGPQLHLYQSDDLLDWRPLATVLSVEADSRITPTSDLRFGKNFECATFFSIGEQDYIILGVEEDFDSKRHNGHYLLWLCGNFILENGKPRFVIKSHGLVDHGISYAPHLFRDSENRLLQLGWADEASKEHVRKAQDWAGCMAHPKELYEISKPVTEEGRKSNIWRIDESSGTMTTLGMRPAPQILTLRNERTSNSLKSFTSIRSKNYELEANFSNLSGTEKFTFNIRESPNSVEVTKIIFDIANGQITVDRTHSSLENLGTNTRDCGHFKLLQGEDLHLRVFVDNSLVEIFANDRFVLTSRIYPSLEISIGASYDLGGFDEMNMKFELWEGLKTAWPKRKANKTVLGEMGLLSDVMEQTDRMATSGLAKQAVVLA